MTALASWAFFEQQPALQRKTSFSHNLDCQIQVKERGKEKERYITLLVSGSERL